MLIDFVARQRLPIPIFTLDTGVLFPETHALWRGLEKRYRLAIRSVRPAQSVEEQARTHGERLWERNPGRCCALRKVEALRDALAGLDAWITGIRRDQTPERAEVVVRTDREAVEESLARILDALASRGLIARDARADAAPSPQVYL